MKLVKKGEKELCKALLHSRQKYPVRMLLIFLICKVYKYKMKKEKKTLQYYFKNEIRQCELVSI